MKIFWRIKDQKTKEIIEKLKEYYGEKTYTKTLERAVNDLWNMLNMLGEIDGTHTLIITAGEDHLKELQEKGKEFKESVK